MFRGRKPLGNEIRIGVQCRNGSRTPLAPDAAPTFRVYAETGGSAVVTGSLPPTERYQTTGIFQYMLPLNSTFSAGRYWVRYAYDISGTHYVVLDSFEVLAGDANGMFNSMFFLDKPSGDWILGVTDSGTVSLHRGPRI